MLFYFTGTGNSLYVAKQLEKSPISIPQAIHDSAMQYKDDAIGIVCPVYGHEMPQMVDNFLPGFDMEVELAINPEKEVEKHLAEVKADIKARKKFTQPVTEEDREWHQKFLGYSKTMPQEAYKIPYVVSEECIGCGICMRVCPAGCIYLEKQRAVHTDENCQMCMACIHICPQKAIQLKMPEKNPNARYRNENIGLLELIAANEQKIK
jgi:NAD-dependent dihydropyrimidine dehydrogenase PreA subunit